MSFQKRVISIHFLDSNHLFGFHFTQAHVQIQVASRNVMFQQDSFPAVSSEGKPSTRDRVMTNGPGVTKKSNLDFDRAFPAFPYLQSQL